MTTSNGSSSRQSEDERKLERLLDEYHQPSAIRSKLETQILELVETYLRESLRPLLIKQFGSAVGSKQDGSLRYTAVANSFFVKVIEKRPDGFWRARTARDLRNWASRVMKNMMLDYFRRKKRGLRVMAELKEVAALAEQRRQHFESRFGVEFDRALDQIDAWELRGSEEERQFAALLRHRYVDGMKYDEIESQLGIQVRKLYKLRDQAIARLKRFGSQDQ